MENYESKQYRSSLSDIRNKNRREEILEAKETEEYQEAREVKIKKPNHNSSELQRTIESSNSFEVKKYGRWDLLKFENGVEAIFKTNGYKKEMAAYILNKRLSFDTIPATIIRKIGKEEGILQAYIPNLIDLYTWKTKNFLKKRLLSKTDNTDILEIALFDYIAWEKDRQHNLFLRDKLYSLDNEHSFYPDQYMKNPLEYWKIFFDKIPSKTLNIDSVMKKLESAISSEDEIINELIKYIPKHLAFACLNRIKRVLELRGNISLLINDGFEI